jgi:hypothetical protein
MIHSSQHSSTPHHFASLTTPHSRTAMSAYDAGSLIVTASTSDDILRLSRPDNGREMIGAMDAFDHDLNFEANDLLYDSCPSARIAIMKLDFSLKLHNADKFSKQR